METLYGNTIITPSWFTAEPWQGDYGTTPRTVRYLSRLEEGAPIEYSLIGADSGSLTFPSGKLFVDGLIAGFNETYLTSDAPYFSVPTSAARIHALSLRMPGRDDWSSLAYLTLRFAEPGATGHVTRSVILRTNHPPSDAAYGVMRVDKNVLGVFDAGTFSEQLHNRDAIFDFTGTFIPFIDQFRVSDTVPGFVANAAEGMVAAIAEYESPETLLALHFDFCRLHSIGEDGEYEPDWEYSAAYEAQRQKYGL